MKYKLITVLIVLSFTFKAGYCQILRHADSVTRKKADSIVLRLGSSVKDNAYLLFSITDRWYLVIVEKQQRYYEYYLNIKDKNLEPQDEKIVNRSQLLSKAFNIVRYQKGYITFNSDFFKGKQIVSEGNITYFYLMKMGVKYGEARLSVKISPNPIDEKLYDYLSSELLIFMSKHAPDKI
ncbi:hypothetical protein G7092_28855 [Mucilaginibacter sp. HC2]|uniref:hypothetical protein n=1 Tax=Mucilaginibacter inviolabilis TaxID=2714892 RepID=UPI00140DA95B|nr:hypothetical protein [Mucilaginibacter inviolabilis]NHA07844.1 hypothetical protein [Mucilaginibacter inviolabilis]